MEQRAGGCLCGAVRFDATLKNRDMGACHCGMCRKWVGGPFVTVNSTEVAWEDEAHIRTFASSPWAERGSCDRCGSALFYRFRGGDGRGQIFLAAGTLDDLDGLALRHEVFTDRRPAGYRFAGELHGLTEAEIMARFRG